MSERRYTIYVRKRDLDFGEFYNKHLKERDDNEFESLYCSTDGVNIDPVLVSKMKIELKKLFNQTLEEGFVTSNSYFYIRRFVWALANYAANKGIPIRVRDISGWEPQLILMFNKSSVRKYIKDPEFDLDKRFSYMTSWAKERGLDLNKKLGLE